MLTLKPHEWLKDRRDFLGLTQPDVEERTAAFGARITQGHLSKVERGRRAIETLGPQRMDALRQALEVSPKEWARRTGLVIVAPAAPDPALLPPTLLEAAEKYGDRFPALRDPAVQKQLSDVRHWRGAPTTADGWFDFWYQNRRNLE